MNIELPAKSTYVALWFALFVVPRVLQRWKIPAAVTAFLIGLLAGPVFGLMGHDHTIDLLATMGIVSLFLFAGLDIEPGDFRRGTRVIGEHLFIRLVALAAVTTLSIRVVDLTWRPAALLALALLTPSTGFILDSLTAWDLTIDQRYWVRTKAVATEILSLAALFMVLQSTSPDNLMISLGVMAAMIFGLPVAFRLFAKLILPYAPRTEFAFLMMTALVCALVTRELGVYYLVGAFVVGMTAQRTRRQLPALANERMLHAIEAFGSLFIPFYFFHAAASLQPQALSWAGLAWGVGFLLLIVPMRMAMIVLHRRWRLGESWPRARRVALPLMPSLVFTLVLARILSDRFHLPDAVMGGLVVYAVVTTLLPSVALGAPPAEFGPSAAASDELVAIQADSSDGQGLSS